MQPLARHEQRPGFDPQQCLQKILQQWSQRRNIKAFQGGDDAKWEHVQCLPLILNLKEPLGLWRWLGG